MYLYIAYIIYEIYKYILKGTTSLSFSVRQLLLGHLILVHPHPGFTLFLWFLGRECLGVQGGPRELSEGGPRWKRRREAGILQSLSSKLPLPRPRGSLPPSPFPPHPLPPTPVWDLPFACWSPLRVRGSMKAETLADLSLTLEGRQAGRSLCFFPGSVLCSNPSCGLCYSNPGLE